MDNVFNGLDTASKIRGIIASRGKTQIDLAKLLKVTPETVSTRMKTNKWAVEELRTIAEEFGLETSDLL